MYLTKSKKWRHCVTKEIARTMIMSLLFGVIVGHVEVWTIEAQAKENADYNTLDGGGVVSLGGNHSAVIKADGSLWTWGWNKAGQLGCGGGFERIDSSEIPIEIMNDVKMVLFGASSDGPHSAAVKNDGSLWMWGSNGWWQLGTDAPLDGINSRETLINSSISR